ncbi:hypothetical protein Q5P01_005846 [Channa striata]|uniref:Uncharacterized protein n=1 Tax=Channa striata TaxID=64152 RepID=A0AA88T3G0_CHASR|nr:hypothetical protein Q5P01_005846 [Channa striata]
MHPKTKNSTQSLLQTRAAEKTPRRGAQGCFSSQPNIPSSLHTDIQELTWKVEKLYRSHSVEAAQHRAERLGRQQPACEFISHVQEHILPKLTSNLHLLSQLDLFLCGPARRRRLTERFPPQRLERYDSMKTY